MPRDLHNRVIVITGASSGIGAATAVRCAEAGMNVVVAARSQEKLEQVAVQVNRFGCRSLVVSCDVARDQDVQELVRRTVETFGRLDVMFANAGYGLFRSVMQTSPEQMRAIFETNFFGTVRCIHAAVPLMCRNGDGHVLICSSACSEISLPMYGFYAATKAAQDSIAGALRAELAGQNIDVTSVHPVGTSTGFWEAVAKVSDVSASLNTPKMLMQTPDHVARKIVRCLRRPCPEVWPSAGSRLGLALTTAVPRMSAMVLRKMMHRRPEELPPPQERP